MKQRPEILRMDMLRLKTLGIEKQRPAGAKPLQRIIGAGAQTDQFRFGCTFQIGTLIPEGALEAAVLVEDNTRRDQGCPGQQIGKTIGFVAVFARLNMETLSASPPPPLTQVTGEHGHDVRIAFGGNHGERMPRDKHHQPGNPLLEAEADGGGERAVQDGDRTRRTAKQDRLGQRTMGGDFKSLHKALRSHLEKRPAAKGEEGQKERTGRKGDGETEDNLDQPTEPARAFAKGQCQTGEDNDDHRDDPGDRPCTDSSIRCSGASHGMPEPAA